MLLADLRWGEGGEGGVLKRWSFGKRDWQKINLMYVCGSVVMLAEMYGAYGLVGLVGEGFGVCAERFT